MLTPQVAQWCRFYKNAQENYAVHRGTTTFVQSPFGTAYPETPITLNEGIFLKLKAYKEPSYMVQGIVLTDDEL